MDVLEIVFDRENTIKVIDTKKGRRFYRCRKSGYGFAPISKKKFESLDQSDHEIYQDLPGIGWVLINDPTKKWKK